MRIEELRARAEIEELLARYGFYADCGAVDAWLDLFCDGAYMDVPDYSGAGGAQTVRLSGREQLRARIVEAPAVRAMRGRMQHHMCGPRTVLVDGDVAQVDSYAVIFAMAEPPAAGGPAAVRPRGPPSRLSSTNRSGKTWASSIRPTIASQTRAPFTLRYR